MIQVSPNIIDLIGQWFKEVYPIFKIDKHPASRLLIVYDDTSSELQWPKYLISIEPDCFWNHRLGIKGKLDPANPKFFEKLRIIVDETIKEKIKHCKSGSY